MAFFLFAPPAQPQGACHPIAPRAALTLPPPDPQAFVLWSSTGTGVPFTAGAASPEGGLVAGGAGQNMLHLQAFGPDGTRLWSRSTPVKGLAALAALEPAKTGYAALGTAANRGWLGLLSADGHLTQTKDLGPGAGGALVPFGKGWAAAVGDDLLLLDAGGAVRTRHGYLADTPHTIAALAPAGDGSLLAAGWVEDEGRPRRAWLAVFDEQGALIWQRPFAPGTFAAVAPLTNRYAVALGGSTLMVVRRETGAVVWERLLAAPGYALSGVDLRAGPPIRALLAAGGGGGHARVVTFSPRGDFLAQEAHHAGTPAALAGGAIIGAARGKPWALALPPPGPWTDPCR